MPVNREDSVSKLCITAETSRVFFRTKKFEPFQKSIYTNLPPFSVPLSRQLKSELHRKVNCFIIFDHVNGRQMFLLVIFTALYYYLSVFARYLVLDYCRLLAILSEEYE